MKVKLYKYTPHIESFVKNPMLRCTPAYELNDPFELQPNQQTLDNFSNNYSGSYLPSDIPSLIKNHTSSAGVISLSETKSNLLMWSHYANEHRGAVIEFTFDVQFDKDSKLLQRGFLSTAFDNKYLFNRVKYRLEREPDNDFFLTPGYGLLSELKEHLSFTKAEAWSYEKEHRFICDLDCADVVCIEDSEDIRKTLDSESIDYVQSELKDNWLHLLNFTKFSSGKYFTIDLNKRLKNAQLCSTFREENKSIFHFYEINPNSVTGIFLGCRTSVDTQNSLLRDRSLNSRFSNLKGNIEKAKLCTNRYEMSFEKIA